MLVFKVLLWAWNFGVIYNACKLPSAWRRTIGGRVISQQAKITLKKVPLKLIEQSLNFARHFSKWFWPLWGMQLSKTTCRGLGDYYKGLRIRRHAQIEKVLISPVTPMVRQMLTMMYFWKCRYMKTELETKSPSFLKNLSLFFSIILDSNGIWTLPIKRSMHMMFDRQLPWCWSFSFKQLLTKKRTAEAKVFCEMLHGFRNCCLLSNSPREEILPISTVVQCSKEELSQPKKRGKAAFMV